MDAAAEGLMAAWAAAMARMAAPVQDHATTDALWRMAEAQRALLTAAAQGVAAGAADPVAAATLARFLDPTTWLFGAEIPDDPGLRRLLSEPDGEDFGRAGLSRGPEAKALREALRAHRALVAQAYGRMAERVAREAVADPAVGPQGAQARWVAAAAAERDALQASDAFLASQAAVLRAALALRAAEAAAVERFCEARGLPTRSEVDALQRTVAELRRELRALKRELAGR